MEQINLALFALLGGPAAPAPPMLAVARIAAQWLIWLVAAGLALGYLRGGRAGRVTIIRTALAAFLALGVNFAVAALWYHPRPFEIGVGHQLLPHAAETSFPSDHATVLFAVAFGLMTFGARRLWWVVALGAALAVAWARVWLGVHWPLDMAGSAAVAGVAVLVLRGLGGRRGVVTLTGLALAMTDRAFDVLHLPESIAPRSRGEGAPGRDGESVDLAEL